MERPLGKRIHVGAQALREQGQPVGGKRHADRRLVPAEAREDVRAALHRLEQVDLAYAAAAAARLAVLDGEQQARHAVDADEAAGDDALDAFVPTLARHHERALAVVLLRGLGLRDFRELRFDGAALVVDALEALGAAHRLVVVVGEQKVERGLRVAHAARRVDARDEREAEVGGGDRLAGRPARAQEGGDAGARRGVDAFDAVGDQRAVLVDHGHEVGHRPQRREVGVAAPEVGVAEAAAQRLDQLEGHADAGQDGAGAGRVGLGVGDRHVFGDEVGRLVMVGDRHADAALAQQLDFGGAGDAAIHRHQEVGIELHDALDGGLGDAVALVGTPRDERQRACSQRAQTAREHRRRRDTVDVEVAEHDDAVAALDGVLERVGDVGEAGDAVGVAPIAVERGLEEALRLPGIVDAARDQRRRDESRQPEIALKTRNGGGISRVDFESG